MERNIISATINSNLLLALLLLLACAHLCGYLLERLKFPRVIGEICGGFLLGPSALGYFSPRAFQWLCNALACGGRLYPYVYWLGLLLLMFISGLEVQKTVSRNDKEIIGAVFLGATVIPFIAGWIAPLVYDFSPYIGTKNNLQALQIVIAVSLALTAIPVLAKMFHDLGIIDTRFVKIVLATATLHDILLWAALAIAAALVSTRGWGSPGIIVSGAFLAGISTGLALGGKLDGAKKRLKKISFASFVPLYFAIVGMKLDLLHHLKWEFFFGFLVFTSVFGTLGTLGAARLINKKDWLSSLNLGIAMNAKGAVGMILATVAFDLGIINETFFVTLVLTAIVTTLFAGCWFRYVLSRGLPLLKD